MRTGIVLLLLLVVQLQLELLLVVPLHLHPLQVAVLLHPLHQRHPQNKALGSTRTLWAGWH